MNDTLRFLAQSVLRMRTTGAVAPSGKRLARAMVDEIGHPAPGMAIIELGPGTGVFTQELLRRFPNNPIVAIEFNHQFAQRLRHHLPRVHVVEGCASDLRGHLHRLGLSAHPIGAVVSGLPLLSLPAELGDRIVQSISDILPPGRRYVQFTYSRQAWKHRQPAGFIAHAVRRVWANLPPAVVMPFERAA